VFGGDGRRRPALPGRVVVRHEDDGLDVGVAVAHELRGEAFADAGQLDPRVYPVLAQERLRDLLDLFGRLHVEEGDLPVEAARALEVDVELVGAVRHHEEEYAPAVRSVGHELLDARDDAR
jgi:hypothetical protein